MTSPDARVGHAIVAGEYPLTVAALATLLVLAAHRHPAGDIGYDLTDRCWLELQRIDPDKANAAWSAAVIDGAPGESLRHISELLHSESTETKETP